MGRFAQFILETIIAAVLAAITVVAGAAFGHDWPYGWVFLIWWVLCTCGWLIIISRSGGDDSDSSGDADGLLVQIGHAIGGFFKSLVD